MKIHHNRIFYVCFCFIILLTNSCKAQKKSDIISSFFLKEKKTSYDKCLDNDDYKYFKQNNIKEAIDLTESSCEALNIRYIHFSENTIKFLDSLDSKNNKQDFVILNKTLISIYNSKPVLTIFKAKNSHKYSVIHNYTVYDETNKKFIVLTDNSSVILNIEKILSSFEDYLYHNKGSLISENIKDLPSTSYKTDLYYVIARVNGKFFIKKYYYSDKDYN